MNVGEDGEIELGELLKDDPSEFINANVSQKLVSKNINGRELLCIYLNQKDVPDEIDDDGVSKLVVSFNDIVKYIIQMPDENDGIVINPDSDNIMLPASVFVSTYFVDRVMTNDKRMIKVLDSLTDEETEYIGKENYELISNIYFTKKTLNEVRESLGISSTKANDLLNEGYQKLKMIVKCNY